MFGPVLYEAFREIKRTFDPHGILNPGKIVDAPPLTTNLRYGAGYHADPRPVRLLGVRRHGRRGRDVQRPRRLPQEARRHDVPVLHGDAEEQHSTRGRANALRLAMTGRLGEAGLGDEGVHEVLDLCLECRACKAECPVGVDVARFKSEFLADYWTRHGTPLAPALLGKCAAWPHWQPFRACVELARRHGWFAASTSGCSASIGGVRCRAFQRRRSPTSPRAQTRRATR